MDGCAPRHRTRTPSVVGDTCITTRIAQCALDRGPSLRSPPRGRSPCPPTRAQAGTKCCPAGARDVRLAASDTHDVSTPATRPRPDPAGPTAGRPAHRQPAAGGATSPPVPRLACPWRGDARSLPGRCDTRAAWPSPTPSGRGAQLPGAPPPATRTRPTSRPHPSRPPFGLPRRGGPRSPPRPLRHTRASPPLRDPPPHPPRPRAPG